MRIGERDTRRFGKCSRLLPIIAVGFAILALHSGCRRRLSSATPAIAPPGLQFRESRPALQFADNVKVQILDGSGRPARNGTAWLSVIGKEIETAISSGARTDDHGRAAIQLSEELRQHLCYDGTARLWFIDSQYVVSGADIPIDALSSSSELVEVTVASPCNLADVAVIGPTGSPVAHARVGPDSLALSAADVGRQLPDEVWTAASMLTDSSGHCRVQVPVGQLNPYMRIEGEAFGMQSFPVVEAARSDTHVYRIGECGRIAARVEGDGNALVRIRAVSLATERSGRAALTMRAGEQREAVLVVGDKLTIRPSCVNSDRFSIRIVDSPTKIDSTRANRVTLQLTPGVRVRGKIVRGNKKIPVVGARVLWSGTALNDGLIDAQTGEDGIYEFRCTSGALSTLGPLRMPNNANVHVPLIEIAVRQSLDDVAVPDIELPEFVWLTGILKDDRDQPVAGEEISYGSDPARRMSTTTGHDGRFWLPVTQPISDAFFAVGRTALQVIQRDPLVLQSKNPRREAAGVIRVVPRT